jgi:hemerythrin-like domain-containing protein
MTIEESGEFETCPYDDAIEMMLAHHLRVREQLVRLKAIDAEVTSYDPDALRDAADLATAAIDLFGREGELHAFDEDGLFFPRMREAARAGDSAVLDALDTVDEEHKLLRPLWPRLAFYLTRLAVPDEPVSLRDFREARLELTGCVLPHLHFEERYVYPAARRLLGPTVLREMVGEMRAHRRSPSDRAFSATP